MRLTTRAGTVLGKTNSKKRAKFLWLGILWAPLPVKCSEYKELKQLKAKTETVDQYLSILNDKLDDDAPYYWEGSVDLDPQLMIRCGAEHHKHLKSDINSCLSGKTRR
jgi:hypothetical protein